MIESKKLIGLVVLMILGLGGCRQSASPTQSPPTGLQIDIPTAQPQPIPLSSTTPRPAIPSVPVPQDGSLFFSLQTDLAGLTFQHQTRLGRKEDGSKMMGGGTVGDFNNDGWQDLFLIGGGMQPDALFLNNGDGTFSNITESAGLGGLHVGSGAAVADIDGDGWLDIFVTSFGDPGNMSAGNHRLYHNNGDNTFTDIALEAGVAQSSPTIPDGFGATFGDYDLDGDLDLFVSGWRINPELGKGNRLFRNDGQGGFTDVTDEAGFVDNGIRGFSPCFADMDGDRYPELLLVADFGTSLYFVNEGNGKFREYTDGAHAGKEWSGMGLATGDFNNDGLLDWYATAIFGRDGDGRGDGNKLYLNRGNNQFTETALSAGVADGGWGWGAMGVDLNHDGWLDIVETNGWSDIPSYDQEITHVWLANGDFTFSEVDENAGILHNGDGLGLLHFDADRDGDREVGITTLNGDFHYYRNELSAPNSNWLTVFLDSSNQPNIAPNGIGSRVFITVNGQEQVRDLLACPHYLTQSELSAHFGVGSASTIDEVRVEWTDGSETVAREVPANQIITLHP